MTKLVTKDIFLPENADIACEAIGFVRSQDHMSQDYILPGFELLCVLLAKPHWTLQHPMRNYSTGSYGRAMAASVDSEVSIDSARASVM